MLTLSSGFLVPFLCGILTEGTEGLAPWHTVFYITIGILCFEAVIFTSFGKGDLQAWNSGKLAGTEQSTAQDIL